MKPGKIPPEIKTMMFIYDGFTRSKHNVIRQRICYTINFIDKMCQKNKQKKTLKIDKSEENLF